MHEARGSTELSALLNMVVTIMLHAAGRRMASEGLQRLHELDQQAEKWQAECRAAIAAKDQDLLGFAREQLQEVSLQRMELTKQLPGRCRIP